MIGDLAVVALAVLVYLFPVCYVVYKYTADKKKALASVLEANKINRETLEVNKKILKELENISKHLAR